MDGFLELRDGKDPSLAALGIVLAAWDEAADAGVPPEMMAYASLFTALGDLVGCYGEDAVGDLMERLAARVRSGEFTFSDAETLQ